MKYIFAFISGFFICLPVFSQEMMEKQYYENSPPLGGDVVIKSSSFKVENDLILKTFEIESLESGAYYMDAWLVAPEKKEGFPEYQVAVNGVLTEFTLKPQTHDWQSLPLTDAKKFVAAVNLKKGINTVSVIGKGPEVPNVEFIKLSSNLSRAGISDIQYREFVESIRNNTLNEVYNIGKEQISSTRGTSGEIYDYYLNIPVNYTTYKSFYFSSGQNVTITTASPYNPLGGNPMIEFVARTGLYSWHIPASSSGNGFLNVTIPETGFYYLFLRVLPRPNPPGTNLIFLGELHNLTVNGNFYADCIASYSVQAEVTGQYPTPANFFTCKIKDGGDTFLLLEDSTGIIRTLNDDGGQKSDGYDWGSASRITTDSTNIKYGHVFSASSNSPYFECDLYMGLESLDVSKRWSEYNSVLNPYSLFPKLQADNSFLSGYDSNYNCIAWSVGDTTQVYNNWMYFDMNDWDNWYDSYGYTRVGATADNAAIALWGKSVDGIEHASVRKNTTIPYPHGFEWESKLGARFDRAMHTRDALEGNAYGSIQHYYKPKNGNVNFSPTAPSRMLQSSFSTSELNWIATLKANMPTAVISEFDTKYLTWEKTWDRPEIGIHSNPYRYAESTEYESLLAYCKKYGKAIWPLVFDKLAKRDIFVISLLRDLTYTGTGNFGAEITRSASVKLPSLYTMQVDYCKGLLIKEDVNIQKSILDISSVKEELFTVNVTTNSGNILLDLNPTNNEKALVRIYNVYGGLEYEANYNLLKGSQTVEINTSNFKKGVCIVQVTIGGKSVSQTINI